MLEVLEVRQLLTTITLLDFSPTAINNLGHVVGFGSGEIDTFPSDGRFWSASGGDVPLDFWSTGLNNNDKVIGSVVEDGGDEVFFLAVDWTAASGDQQAPIGLGGEPSYGLSINDDDQVVGTTSFGVGYLADYDTDQTTPLAFAPFAINDSGTIVGLQYQGSPTDSTYQGVEASASNPANLTLLGGNFGSEVNGIGPGSNITGVNASNQVVGALQGVATIWNGTTPTSLGNLGGALSFATAINDSGEVVGSALIASGASHAFYWTPSSGPIDLNTLLPANSGWTLERATGIDDNGQIIGYGTYNGQPEGFFLDTAPTSTADTVGWDAAKGTVDFTYTNGGQFTTAPQITFAWSSTPTINPQSTTIPGSISGLLTSSTTPYTGSRDGSSLTTPPTGTKFLVMKDTVAGVTTTAYAPYNPTVLDIDSYSSVAGEPLNTFGRFFSTISVPNESLTITISPELAVLDQGSSASGGGASRAAESPCRSATCR